MLGHLFVYLFVNFFSKEASVEQFSPSRWDLVASGTFREVNITYLLDISLRINSYNQFWLTNLKRQSMNIPCQADLYDPF